MKKEVIKLNLHRPIRVAYLVEDVMQEVKPMVSKHLYDEMIDFLVILDVPLHCRIAGFLYCSVKANLEYYTAHPYLDMVLKKFYKCIDEELGRE